MTPEPLEMLNRINFPWKLKKPGKDWKFDYNELVEYDNVHKDCLPNRHPHESTVIGILYTINKNNSKSTMPINIIT
jgi:hypothetical protein